VVLQAVFEGGILRRTVTLTEGGEVTGRHNWQKGNSQELGARPPAKPRKESCVQISFRGKGFWQKVRRELGLDDHRA